VIDPDLLKILCCPETHQKVRLADPAVIGRLNRQIADGALKNRAGHPVQEQVEGGLIRSDGKFLYPIRHDIPMMLADEGIPL